MAELVGDPCALVLLSQLIYWSRRGTVVIERDGWIHKTAAQWQQETGMTWKVQHRARRILLEQGLIEERLREMPARLEFRLQLDTLLPRLSEQAGMELPVPDWAWVADRQEPTFGRLLGRCYLFGSALTMHMSVPAAMLASRLIAATGQRLDAPSLQPSSTRWVQLHRADWLCEAGLSRDQWQTARRDLRALGLLHERRRNYPRRVDLAIDLQAVRMLVAGASPDAPTVDETGVRDAGADRAILVGGFGHRPIQPAGSPNPADSGSPIQPTFIAQSNPYLLQGIQLQLPLQIGWTSSIWGGGGFEARTRQQAHRRIEELAHELCWPECFDGADREVATRHLKGLDADEQQLVLDEIDWQRASKQVRSPVGLLRTLCVKAREGTFVADGAHRIAGARQRRAELQSREREARVTAPAQQQSDPEQVRAHVERARAVARAVRARGLE